MKAADGHSVYCLGHGKRRAPPLTGTVGRVLQAASQQAGGSGVCRGRIRPLTSSGRSGATCSAASETVSPAQPSS